MIEYRYALYGEGERQMTNNAKIGGILAIVSGGIGVIWSLIFLAMAVFMVGFNEWGYNEFEAVPPGLFMNFFMVLYIIMAIVGLCIAALSIVGGVYGMKKKYWGLALTGAIAGALIFFPCGIVAIVFTVLAKPEFSAIQPPTAQPA